MVLWLLVRLFGFGLMIAAAAWPVNAKADIVLTDAMGREVRLAKPAQRIVTNESLLLYALALIDQDPVARIAGWAAPHRIDRGVYAAFQKKFPAIDGIPEVGAVVPANVSVESLLSVDPDLLVVSIWQADWDAIAQRLAAVGVPVIFLDGPVDAAGSPAEATVFSIKLLGRAIGRMESAEAFSDLVLSRYRFVTERLAAQSRPNVLVDVHAGSLCCYTPGANNRITQNIELAGAHNIGADVVSGYDGQFSSEYALGIDPPLYIATGSPHLSVQGGLVVGAGVDEATARASLRAVTSRHFLDALTAVKEGRAYGISHQLLISTLGVVAFECIAKWAHPEIFADLDPAATLAEINDRFLAVPIEGTLWVGLTNNPPVKP